MKLRSLWVDDYRSLKELELTFPEQPRLPIALIAGVNGTGKSSILRALAHIFHALEYSQAPHIPFRLEYQIGRGTEIYAVTIRGDGHGAVSGVEFTVTKGDEPAAPREPGEWPSFLPNRVVIYTSGSLTEWQPIFAQADVGRERREHDWAEALRAMQEGEGGIEEVPREAAEASALSRQDGETLSSRILLLSPEHLRLALLATLALDEGRSAEVRRHIYERVNLKGLEGFALRLEPLASRVISTQLRERLWRLLGDRPDDPELIRQFEALTAGTAPILPEKPLERVRALASVAAHRHRNPDGSYHLRFDMDDNTRKYLVSEQGFPNALQLYEFLADLRMRGVLAGVDLVLRKTDLADIILDRHLSDGEFELLGRTALFLLMQEQREALFLFDEPETHFNDVWKRELVDMLSTTLGEQSSSAVLLTTHSSIVLSDVETEQILLLKKTETGGVERVSLRVPTLGADPSEILIAVLGASESIGKEAQDYLDAQLRRDWTIADLPELERLIQRTGPGYHRSELRTIWRRLSAAQA